MLRSIGGVLAGFVAMAVAVMIGTVALTTWLIPGGVARMRATTPAPVVPARYLAANLTLSFFAAVLGGWLAAVIAGSAPVQHALALGALLVVMGIASAKQAGGSGNHPGQPAWYPWVITVIGVAGALAGGFLRS